MLAAVGATRNAAQAADTGNRCGATSIAHSPTCDELVIEYDMQALDDENTMAELGSTLRI
jgi:hypothetical protein